MLAGVNAHQYYYVFAAESRLILVGKMSLHLVVHNGEDFTPENFFPLKYLLKSKHKTQRGVHLAGAT